MKIHASHHIDATGLICPEPLMLLKQAIQKLTEGDIVLILVTDVHAELDFEIWCERFGHLLELKSQNKGSWEFEVTKGKV